MIDAVRVLDGEPAPWVDWRFFSSFGAYEELLNTRSKTLLHRTTQKERALEKELGTLELVYGDDTIKKEHGVKASAYLLAGILGYGVVSTAFAGLAIVLVLRRESGVLKRLRGTPLPPTTYLGSVITSGFVATTFLWNHLGTRALATGKRLPWFAQRLYCARNLGDHPLLTWWFGGLNHHVEHHLLPAVPVACAKAAQLVARMPDNKTPRQAFAIAARAVIAKPVEQSTQWTW